MRNATIVIEEGGARTGFTPSSVTVWGGNGAVTVVNLDSMDHTVTSVARGPDGLPVFDVRIRAGTTATVPGIETLAAGAWELDRKFHPGMRGVLTVEGTGGGVEPERPTFELPLVVPPTERGARIRLVMRRSLVRTLPDGPRTSMWTYDGTYPGPTIRRRGGRGTRVTVVNRLPKGAGSMSTHLHGDHHALRSTTGSPRRYLIRPGIQSHLRLPPDRRRPRRGRWPYFWYHDHRMDRTSLNNWRGLQGMFIVADPLTPGLRLPTGGRDVPLLISERSFRDDNPVRTRAPTPEWRPPRPDGLTERRPRRTTPLSAHRARQRQEAPYLDVTATRYRLRLLNSSTFTIVQLRAVQRTTVPADRDRQRPATKGRRATAAACSAPRSAPTSSWTSRGHRARRPVFSPSGDRCHTGDEARETARHAVPRRRPASATPHACPSRPPFARAASPPPP